MELWQTTLRRLQGQFLKIAESGKRLGCLLVQFPQVERPEMAQHVPAARLPEFEGWPAVWQTDYVYGAPYRNLGIMRRYCFVGETDAWDVFRDLSAHAGNCLINSNQQFPGGIPRETWEIGDATYRWTSLVFHLAERGFPGSPLQTLGKFTLMGCDENGVGRWFT